MWYVQEKKGYWITPTIQLPQRPSRAQRAGHSNAMRLAPS